MCISIFFTKLCITLAQLYLRLHLMVEHSGNLDYRLGFMLIHLYTVGSE